jgi:hypothetical protein
VILERKTVHIDDDNVLIAIIDRPTTDTLGSGETHLIRYQYNNTI